MWRRFKNSFQSREHMKSYLMALTGLVLLSLCLVLFIVGWFVL